MDGKALVVSGAYVKASVSMPGITFNCLYLLPLSLSA